MPVRRKITALAVGAVAVSGGIPAGASAAEPGFTVDPQSPAGVEYQVPLDSARGRGGGTHHGGGGNLGGTNGGGGGGSNGGGGATGSGGSGSGTSASGGTSSPNLFGAGIAPATGSGSSNGASGAVGKAGGNGSGGQASGVISGARHLPTALTASADYSSTGPIAGIVAAILLVGVGFGLFLRMRARRPHRIFS